MFNQIDLYIRASPRLFLALLLPSYLAIAGLGLPSSTINSWTALLLLSLLVCNVSIAYASTLGKTRIKVIFVRKDKLYLNTKQPSALAEISYLVWLTPKIAILGLKQKQQGTSSRALFSGKQTRQRIVFICPLSTSDKNQLRRFRVNSLHNKNLYQNVPQGS